MRSKLAGITGAVAVALAIGLWSAPQMAGPVGRQHGDRQVVASDAGPAHSMDSDAGPAVGPGSDAGPTVVLASDAGPA